MEKSKVEKYLDQYVSVTYKLFEDDEEREFKGILRKGYTPPIFRKGHENKELEENGYWVQGTKTSYCHFLRSNLVKIKKMKQEEIDKFNKEQAEWIKPSKKGKKK